MNNNYRNFPPGRNRAIAYSDFLIRRRLRTLTFSRIRNLQPSIGIYENLQPSIGNIENFQSFIYENLKDVKIGISLSKLISNSEINIFQNVKNNNHSLCVICQDDFLANDIVRIFKCKHLFHINCIERWLCENKKCPLCKEEFN